MSNTTHITHAEWSIMQVLWKRSPQRASEIVAALTDAKAWHRGTVNTLLSRLEKREALRVTKEANHFLFSPLVTEDECIKSESQSFLERVFGGAVQPLLVHFVEHQKLSPDDLDELKQILRKKKS